MDEDANAPEAIERVATLSAAIFRARYLQPGRPVVITGAVRDWPALDRWDPTYLGSTRTTGRVPVDVYEDGDFFATGGALGLRKRVHLPFVDYLAPPRSTDRRRTYAPDLALDRYFPELERDVAVPSLLPFEARPRLFLFAGHGAATACHFHPFTHALTCQVTGKKRFTLYPPDAGPSLYPNPWFAPAFHWSRVDFLRPDYDRFPKVRAARAQTCLLEPGDALFIPVHWWHWTQGVDFSVSALVSWKASVKSWRFPRPGLACLFARLAWPLQDRARNVARGARDRIRAISGRA